MHELQLHSLHDPHAMHFDHERGDSGDDLARYLDELVREMRQLNTLQIAEPIQLRHAPLLLTAEIDRVWKMVYSNQRGGERHPSSAHHSASHAHDEPAPSDPLDDSNNLTLQEKIPIPYYPKCNFIGRILGPRGISVKQLEADTGCHILVRGEGSVKDTRREQRLRSQPGWEHLSEPLHVLVSATDSIRSRCEAKLAAGVNSVKALLTPTNDEHKRKQLVQLAIINGTYRPDTRGGDMRPFEEVMPM